MNQALLSSISTLVDANNDQSRIPLADGLLAIRCGRNEVWKVAGIDGNGTFVKFCNSKEHYRRELAGLAAASELAQRNQRFLAPTIVFQCDEQLVIATSAMNGLSLAQLLKRAFRLDQNPLRRQEPIRRALDSIQSAVQWLKELHSLSQQHTDALYDHSTDGVLNRIRHKVARIQQKMEPKESREMLLKNIIEGCEAMAERLPHQRRVPVFGDPTPGNIFIQPGRVGFIDFEDFGSGDPMRDWTVFLDSLSPRRGRWKRWTSRELDSLFESVGATNDSMAFYRMELMVDQLVSDPRPESRSVSKVIAELNENMNRSSLAHSMN